MEEKKAPLGLDRLELLQTFVRIVEAGSLSAAAAQTNSTQPTVSRRLKALEAALGVRLLQRSTHTMRLTADGERCYERAKALIATWDAFEYELRGTTRAVEGVLRVVVPHAFGQDRLVEPLADFLTQNPGVQVEWLLHDDRAQQDYIAAGIDCAIQVGEVGAPSMVVLKLAEVPRIVAASPALLAGGALPVHAEDLEKLPWLALHTYYRNEIELTHEETGERRRVALQPRFSTDSLYALRSAAVRGLGVCIGSAWMLAEDIAAGRLVHLVPEWRAAPLPLQLVYPYARYYPARLRRFIEVMKEAVPQVLRD